MKANTNVKRGGIAGLVASWLALVTMIGCNAAFEAFKLGGVTSAEVSNQVFTWFMPAGYVFSIWGVIYAALVIWMVAETRRTVAGGALATRHAALFVTSCALNVGWLVAFHFQQIAVSVAVLMALWACLATLYMGLRDEAERTKLNLAPFSLYFAWSTVAVIVNCTNFATRIIEAPIIVHQASTVLLSAAVLIVAYLSTRNSQDFVFPLVVIWALVGVGVHLLNVDLATSAAVLALTALGAVALYAPMLFKLASSPEKRPSR